jgi:hypothetical protein
MSVLVAITDHAAERFRQRVGSRTGALDVKPEVVGRVVAAWDAGRVTTEPPAGATGARGTLYLRGARIGPDAGVVYVCRRDGEELVVVTLWEDEATSGGARVPRRFTDALKDSDDAVAEHSPRERERRRDLRDP